MSRKMEQALASSQGVASLFDRPLRAGANVSFRSSEGTVNVVRDESGDWTIMVGVSTRSERFSSITFSLEGLGFFRGAENDGMLYFVWTSALEENNTGRSLVEAILTDTLRVIQVAKGASYIS